MAWTDDRLQERFDSIDRRFDEVDRRFEQVDKRFEQVDRRFEQVDKRFDKVEGELIRLHARMDDMYRVLVIAGAGVVATLIAGICSLVATQM